MDTIIVEPSSLFRAGLDYLLKDSRYRIVARIDMTRSGGDVPSLKGTPDLMIVGTSIGGRELVAVVEDLTSQYPDARLVCIGKTGELPDIAALLHADVDGVLMADIPEAVLIKSLDLVMAGETVVPNHFLKFAQLDDPVADNKIDRPDILAEVAPRAAGPLQTNLSAREREILQLLVNGDTNKTIGLKLSLSDATVKVHVKGILRKIQVQNRTQAAIWAIHHLFGDASTNAASETHAIR